MSNTNRSVILITEYHQLLGYFFCNNQVLPRFARVGKLGFRLLMIECNLSLEYAAAFSRYARTVAWNKRQGER